MVDNVHVKSAKHGLPTLRLSNLYQLLHILEFVADMVVLYFWFMHFLAFWYPFLLAFAGGMLVLSSSLSCHTSASNVNCEYSISAVVACRLLASYRVLSEIRNFKNGVAKQQEMESLSETVVVGHFFEDDAILTSQHALLSTTPILTAML
ncbi:hypothetical protein L7F22_006440 [Adiantum nelumboides]|nr:hypothetical protein [Adiantum nelumboides]